MPLRLFLVAALRIIAPRAPQATALDIRDLRNVAEARRDLWKLRSIAQLLWCVWRRIQAASNSR
jgi:hypothetical protein